MLERQAETETKEINKVIKSVLATKPVNTDCMIELSPKAARMVTMNIKRGERRSDHTEIPRRSLPAIMAERLKRVAIMNFKFVDWLDFNKTSSPRGERATNGAKRETSISMKGLLATPTTLAAFANTDLPAKTTRTSISALAGHIIAICFFLDAFNLDQVEKRIGVTMVITTSKDSPFTGCARAVATRAINVVHVAPEESRSRNRAKNIKLIR